MSGGGKWDGAVGGWVTFMKVARKVAGGETRQGKAV